MKISFKSADIQELNYVREYHTGYNIEGSTGIWEYQSHFQYAGIDSRAHRIHVPGVFMALLEGAHAQQIVHTIESDFPYLQMHFEITTSGCQYFPDAQHEPETHIYEGQHALLFYPALKGDLHYLPRENGFSVEIELSLDFIRGIFNYDLGVLKDFGEKIEKNHPAIMGNRSYPLLPRMREILFEMRHCPYAGSLKKIFVEAKVVELLAMQVHQITQEDTRKMPALRKDDIHKIHAVKDIITANLHAHYSIGELCRMAGINRTKLQAGFKELFGSTVIGYLTDVRMEHARELLHQRSYTTISEISGFVGYKNPQHFTSAFKRKFGYLPKDLRGL